MDHYVGPHLQELESDYRTMHRQVEAKVRNELEDVLDRGIDSADKKVSFLARIFGSGDKNTRRLSKRQELDDITFINAYKQRGLETGNDLDGAVFRSLYRVLGTIVATRGYLGRDMDSLLDISTNHASNYLASRYIGKRVNEIMLEAIEIEGYQLIPDADKPILFSLKGASAAGKSSLRPRLREQMDRLGIAANAYGTISPDIWRRLLIDYEALGEAYKYGGRLSSSEVNIIDGKLDRYIRDKADERGSIPHLMVDRFRFDSFNSEKVSRVLQDTYVRYIDTMYMYFVITPPEATVERGWLRGLERGRYKAVDDFLGHCVEAYVGMPKLLFKYLGKSRPGYQFEFLDNSVAKGTFPSLVARGSQGRMQIYRLAPLIDIERYQRINEMATSPHEVHGTAEDLKVSGNLQFLRECIRRIDLIEFVDIETDSVYLNIRSGKFSTIDEGLLKTNLQDETMREAIEILAPQLLRSL